MLRKVGRDFRSDRGAHIHAGYRSVIGSARLHGKAAPSANSSPPPHRPPRNLNTKMVRSYVPMGTAKLPAYADASVVLPKFTKDLIRQYLLVAAVTANQYFYNELYLWRIHLFLSK